MDGQGLCIEGTRPVTGSVHVIPILAPAKASFGSPSEARYGAPHHTLTLESRMLIQASQAQGNLRYNQEQSEEGSSEEEDADADPTYLVPQGHGRFALRWSGPATAADNFAKGNAQPESAIIANWLVSGLEVAMNRMLVPPLVPARTHETE